MSQKLEYRILPQGERDDFHSHVTGGGGGNRVTTQYCCLFTLTFLIIFLILAGVATLTASIYYSEQVTTTFGRIWFGYSVEDPTSASSSLTSPQSVPPSAGDSESFKDQSSTSRTKEHEIRRNLTSAERNSTDFEDKKHHESTGVHHHHISHHSQVNRNSSSSGHSFGNASFSDQDWQGERNLTDSGELLEEDMESAENESALDVEDLKAKFAETMRELEKRMETITGIRKAEFVIPMFMLICFLLMFSMISICCCILMKRKDKRRRKLFGKLITDLQTGDSKTVLLNNMDLDD